MRSFEKRKEDSNILEDKIKSHRIAVTNEKRKAPIPP